MGKRPSQMVSNACDYRFLMPVRIAAANTGAYSVPQNGRRRNTQLSRRVTGRHTRTALCSLYLRLQLL